MDENIMTSGQIEEPKMNIKKILKRLAKIEVENAIYKVKIRMLHARADKYKLLLERISHGVMRSVERLESQAKKCIRKLSKSRSPQGKKYDARSSSETPSESAGSSYDDESEDSFSLPRGFEERNEDMSEPDSE